MKRYIWKNRTGKRLIREEDNIRTGAGKWFSDQRERLTALFLAGTMVFSISAAPLSAAAALFDDPTLCEHHPVHTEQCGYAEGTPEEPCGHIHDEACGYSEGVEGAPCGHEHDDSCGYEAPSEGTPCGHVHDETCGYVPATEGVPCDMGCQETDLDGNVIHAPECAYVPADPGAACSHEHDSSCGYTELVEGSPCTHTHDEACGYEAPVEGTPCGHVHDETCGYVPAGAGSPCTFHCPICHGADYALDGRVEITLPEEDSLTAGERTDLLAGVQVAVEADADPAEYGLAVYSIVDSAEGLPVELGEGRYLTPEEGRSYLMIYAAYDARGELAAAAERTVSAVEAVPLTGEPGSGTITATGVISQNNWNVEVTIDFSGCDLPEEALEILTGQTLEVAENSAPYTRETDLEEYFAGQSYAIQDTAKYWMGIFLKEAGDRSDTDVLARYRDRLANAEVTMVITSTAGAEAGLGIGTGGTPFAALFDSDRSTGEVFSGKTAHISGSPQWTGGECTEIRIKGTYGELIGTNDSGYAGPALVLLTADYAEPMYDSEEKALAGLAEKYGIHPGTKAEGDGPEVWTVYDAKTEEAARIKATVTLPEDTASGDGYYLYIREVEEGKDPYYPSEQALKDTVGDYNDAQCYAIHWVRVYQLGSGKWTYSVQTTSVLEGDEGGKATVQIEYRDKEAYLKGHQAQRKLQVYNSRQTDGSELEDVGELTAVTATDDAYTGFTFQTNRGGPYVFVSKKLFEGYVSGLAIDTALDGTAPFDEDDKAGNDSGDKNKIIRSYDKLQYTLKANYFARSAQSTVKEGTLWFEASMDADLTEARFQPAEMSWLGGSYTIEYLDANGEVVVRETAAGCEKPDGTKVSSLNELISGSGEGEKSYTTGIVTQRLRGSRTIVSEGGIAAGEQSCSVTIQVLGAKDGDEIEPTFRAWFAGNEDNYGSEGGEGEKVHLAQKVEAVVKDTVTVSAAARFNLEVAENTNVSYKGWFDSEKGKEVGPNSTHSYTVEGKTIAAKDLYALLESLAALEENAGKSDPEEFTDNTGACASQLADLGVTLADLKGVFTQIRYGRITGYGVILQIYNDVTVGSGKGFKGVSLPQGDITFNLALATALSGEGAKQVDPAQYYPLLWEYNENENQEQGNQGKNMYWAYLASTKYAAWAAPYNSNGGPSACYNGGDWQLTDPEGRENGYPFRVSGYDLNFLDAGLSFPTHKAGNSGASDGYNSYIGSFSSGYVQVLNVFPRVQKATVTMATSITVRDLTVTTTDGTTISTGTEDTSGYGHEVNQKDNHLSDSIPLYAPGGLTKANAFCTIELFNEKDNFTSKKYFLGTDFWGTSYDCSAFAGQEITLVGATRINAGDAQIRHMNLLQLFDSKVLSILPEKGEPRVICGVGGTKEGRTTFLYAADPKYPQGYDTNAEGVMAYMSGVREEDLIYFRSLEELEAKGYTCVGVLAELRNWTIYGEGGYSTAVAIPMKVSDREEFLNTTVGTVNTVRVWTEVEDMENGTVTWADGKYNAGTGKNSVEGYTPMEGSTEDHYRAESANKAPYVKTEYANGQVTYDSNAGGYVAGSSLLILGYKSRVNIEVTNGKTEGGTLPTYDMAEGSYTVDYKLNGIIAERDNTAGKPQTTWTNLTVQAKLDTDRTDGKTDQRISVASDSYHMVPNDPDKMVLVDETGQPLEEQSVAVTSDQGDPTTVRYAFKDEKTGELDTEHIYTIQVYAQRDTNGTQVTFEIENVEVGVAVPAITFEGLIDPEVVANDDRITATATISGTSDVRAYTTTAGNKDTTTIGIVRLNSTGLVKRVDRDYVELDGAFTYTVTYSNTGQESVNVYLYDLLPDNKDGRISRYQGEAILREIGAELSGGDGNFTAGIQFYYSKLPYQELNARVRSFGGGSQVEAEDRRAAILEMLESETYEKDGKQEPVFHKLGRIDGTGVTAGEPPQFVRDKALDALIDGEDHSKLIEEMAAVTGIYAVVTNLSPGRSLSIKLTVQGKGNRTGDLYWNRADSWLGTDANLPMESNMVDTTVLSRAISGVVWADLNRDGIRQESEPRIKGVTCALFKWDEEANQYEPVPYNGGPNERTVTAGDTEVAAGEPVRMVTGADGAYSFGNLPDGQYVVAFSGAALERYNRGASKYQVNGKNDSATSDGVALEALAALFPGIDAGTYQYAIAYGLTETGEATGVTAVPLHTIDDIVQGNITLVNNVERVDHQDLGLIAEYYELPATGGAGTAWCLTGGLSLAAAGIAILWLRRRTYRAGSAENV